MVVFVGKILLCVGNPKMCAMVGLFVVYHKNLTKGYKVGLDN